MKNSTKINQYIHLLQAWNKTHNLVSKSQENNLQEHIEDSLSIFDHTSDTLLDLGSGGGLPGIPIAISGPNKKVFLIESNSKKSSFLLNATNKMDLKNVTVINSRVEDLDLDQLPIKFEIIARAVGTVGHVVGLTRSLLDKPGIQLKLMKTELQLQEEPLPVGYVIKKIYKISSKEKDKDRILVTIEKDG